MTYKSPNRTRPRTIYTNREFEDHLLFLCEHYNMNNSEVIRLAVATLYSHARGEAR